MTFVYDTPGGHTNHPVSLPGPGCSQKHIPSYLKHPNLKDAGSVFVVSVNDPFVMNAWGQVLDPTGSSNVSDAVGFALRTTLTHIYRSDSSPTPLASSPSAWSSTSTPPKSLATHEASVTRLSSRTAKSSTFENLADNPTSHGSMNCVLTWPSGPRTSRRTAREQTTPWRTRSWDLPPALTGMRSR